MCKLVNISYIRISSFRSNKMKIQHMVPCPLKSAQNLDTKLGLHLPDLLKHSLFMVVVIDDLVKCFSYRFKYCDCRMKDTRVSVFASHLECQSCTDSVQWICEKNCRNSGSCTGHKFVQMFNRQCRRND